ncbi:hypothetical protein EPUS_01541 [Endocarpon pusillum Z07020]|uniref:Uncharacterized protein n=1 Tax=Endocarpon pusillum (strain Z07020 / HMAS-L-300199) TaxID=1263415 RepID=U1GUK3_ENDPU|nr:uncharacterized protein EPUS_01541 [Endocarpon pusillum Z07020]ERF75711.1 hypothetical protein EPUS_01541 [Endocarpon pusillum Z07020]
MTIRASHLNDQSRRHRFLSAVGSFLAITGFIVQFIGLGALHWSATIIVLGVSFIMMIIRAFVRRGLAKDPSCVSIPEKFELVWLALRSVRNDWKDVLTAADDNNHSIPSRDCDWGILTGLIQKDPVNGLYAWQPALLTAKRPKSGNTLKDSIGNETELEQLSKHEFILGFRGFHSQKSYEMHAIRRQISIVPDIPRGEYTDLASKLAAAMIGVMNIMNMSGNIVWKNKGRPPWLNHHWWVDVQQGLREQPLKFWVVDMGPIPDKAALTEQLTAGLSLWMYSLLCQKNSLDRLCNQNDLRNSNAAFLRIIGSSDSCTAEQMEVWMPGTALDSITSSNFEGLHVPRREPLSSWPVFGVYYSASFKMLDPINAKTERTFTLRSAEDAKPQDIVIKTTSRESFEIECALEIFSLFMLSLCMSVDRVKGETVQIVNWLTEEMGEEMINSVFTALAQEVIDAGLENNTDLALRYIIPAFAKFRLLPKCRSNPVRAPRERKIKKHQNAHVAATLW